MSKKEMDAKTRKNLDREIGKKARQNMERESDPRIPEDYRRHLIGYRGQRAKGK